MVFGFTFVSSMGSRILILVSRTARNMLVVCVVFGLQTSIIAAVVALQLKLPTNMLLDKFLSSIVHRGPADS